MTEQQLRQRIADIAVAWLQGEDKGEHRERVTNLYHVHRPIIRGDDVDDREIWHTAFVVAITIAADVMDIFPSEFKCKKMVEFFQERRRWHEGNAYTPVVGDVIFYRGSNIASEAGDTADHVGIVIFSSGNRIKIVEGDTNGVAVYRTMNIYAKHICGYGVPDYAEKAVKPVVAAIWRLASIGVIHTPQHWIQAIIDGEIKDLDELLLKAAEKIVKVGPSSSTTENGIGSLVAAGVINTPDQWLVSCRTFPSLRTLLCALGGAIK